MIDINNMRVTNKEVEDALELKMLRDHFAMYALHGLIAEIEPHAWGKIPKVAYEIADLMLEARKEKK